MADALRRVPAADPWRFGLDGQPESERIWRTLCPLGEGASGTVWLCDWYSTLPFYAASNRPDWASNRWGESHLVALKTIKRPLGGRGPHQALDELKTLRRIPRHENVVSLYDYFMNPITCELFMVFEFMEGNLHQLLLRRRLARHALADGLLRSIFGQITTGLHHVHMSGYIHRDLKPENVLVSTIGFASYPSHQLHTGSPDLEVAVKISDFGLATEAVSQRPYTGYIATRWYRAPEVLLRSSAYSQPVDIWALGLILVELVNMEPLFPGRGELDQLNRINRVLGHPSDEFRVGRWRRSVGGGPWAAGLNMAKALGFSFHKWKPVHLSQIMKNPVQPALIDCAARMLRYDPNARITTSSLLTHPYLEHRDI